MIIRPKALLSFALASLIAAGCGGDGTTKPDNSIPDPNKDRLEITFAYANGVNISMASMDLFQITKDGRLATPLVSTPGLDMAPEWSNDGKKIVFMRESGSGWALWAANADLTGLRQLVVDSTPAPNTFNNQLYPSWSPDGTSIVFLRMIADSASGIAVINADGSGLRWVTMAATQPSWSSTNRIAYGSAGSIWTINPDGSGVLKVTTGGNDETPKWSRDGSKLVFEHVIPSVGTNHDNDFDIVTVNADGTGRKTLVTGGIYRNPSWSPDGAWVLYERVDISDPSQPKCTLLKIPAAGGTPVNLTPDRTVGYCGGSSWRPF